LLKFSLILTKDRVAQQRHQKSFLHGTNLLVKNGITDFKAEEPAEAPEA